MLHITSRTARAVAVAALVGLPVLSAAACGGSGTSASGAGSGISSAGPASHSGSASPTASGGSPAASASARTYGCLTPKAAAAGSFDLTTDGGSLDAYYQDSDAGSAKVAIVFSHQAGGGLCDWLPHLADFTKAGYAALTYTSGGGPGEIQLAVKYLAGKGISKVVLIGASKGGTASLVAAAQPASLPLPLLAVLTLSAPLTYRNGDDAGQAVTTIRLPEFFAAESDDSPFNGAAKALNAAAVSDSKQLKLYSGSRHGALLLDDGALPDVLAFLSSYAPTG